MIQVNLKEAKSGFFDRAAVIKAVDRAKRKVLSKFGAFVRQRAKTSIRKRKGTSPPGSPPYSHAGHLRKFLFFSYDRDRDSVVIGPAITSQASGAPETLEYGGSALIPSRFGSRQVEIEPRPFMGPALQAELPQLPALWRDSVRS